MRKGEALGQDFLGSGYSGTSDSEQQAGSLQTKGTINLLILR